MKDVAEEHAQEAKVRKVRKQREVYVERERNMDGLEGGRFANGVAG